MIRYFVVLLLVVNGCSYPLDPDVGGREVMRYATQVEKVLPSGWKMFSNYNPYGFGHLLIRTQDNKQFLKMPFGFEWYLELLVELSAHPNIWQKKISREEYARKQNIQLEIDKQQRELFKAIKGRDIVEFDTIEYLPVTLADESRITEFNKLVDQRRLNEVGFPQYYTETFGVTFRYPKRYEIDGIDLSLIRQFHDMVEKVKAVFPRYDGNVR